MKKLFLFLILLIPITVKAETNLDVKLHLIDAEVEIAGALRVKELILIEGKTKNISRNINYKNVDKKWDEIPNFNLSPMYNGYSLENIKVSALALDEIPDFNYEIKDYFEEMDLEKKQTNFFTKVSNNLGANINISYSGDDSKYTAYHIEYLVTNVVVIHNDVDELYHVFNNLNYKADETLIRVILPYETDSKLFKVWMHGPSTGELNTLAREDGDIVGVLGRFPNLNSNVSIRMIIPKEQVGIDLYLNKTKVDAFDSIVKVEEAKINKDKMGNISLLIMKWITIILSILYILGSYFLYKYSDIKINIIYLILGVIINIFNILFKFNYIYIYFIILVPITILLIKKLKK